MRAFIVPALLAATAMGPSPAMAKTDIYAEAAASGITPQTAGEMLQCALYWDAWARSLNPDHYREGVGIWDKKWLSTLNPAIQLPAARETADYWFSRAKAQYKKIGKPGAYDKGIKDAYEYNIEALDERKFMRFMGECARPA